MTSLVADSLNDIQIALSDVVMKAGADVTPRGMRTREILGCSFILEQPRNRLTTLVTRKWSAGLAVGELAWHLRGDEDVAALEFYTPRWRDFADTAGIVQGSCYGARIFKATKGVSQWDSVKRLLLEDPSSRRAVLNFRVDEDVSRKTNDISCTNTLQFLIRDNQLHAFVNMRSNDLIWGVPYDAFLFTTFQELMAVELGVELGKYYHSSSSMHIYERHFPLAQLMARDASNDLGSMPPIESFESVMRMAREESHLRAGGGRSGVALRPYAECCIELLSRHRALARAA